MSSAHRCSIAYLSIQSLLKFPSPLRQVCARTMATVRQQPSWQSPPDLPSDFKTPPLKIYNSLTRSKNLFLPIDAKAKKVTWYACGPTVYDDAHLGHARNYVSTDIIRRILKDYFKYDVKFVMNITDVDDKIIVRGRQQYLLGEYLAGRLEQHPPSAKIRREALEAYVKKSLPRLPYDTPTSNMKQVLDQKYADVIAGKSLDPSRPAGDEEAKIRMHIKTVLAASQAMISLENKKLEESSEDFQNNVQDILLPYLDALYGSSIDASNHSIFTKLTQKFEARFMEDVRALNCLDPDEVTRVTEYGPQIVDFVKKIEDNEFAYKTSDGSVYFDIKAFEDANNSYARLEPGSRNDQGRQAEGEGNLTQRTTEKRSPSDFALWKSSRPGEPSWPSPWGQGRPGWHIECSAMASDKLGPRIDIHSGGIDLAFPHHDNELAQSEAYWLQKGQHNHQWVNYFMHMGHLSIQGSKMSKSLKNFITIREALSRGTWTPRGLRIVFLLGYWAGPIEITEDLIREGSFWEDKLNNFFINAKDALARPISQSDPDVNKALREALQRTQTAVEAALCNSFDTREAMNGKNGISELITEYNSSKSGTVSSDTVKNIAQWITSILNIFGLNGDAPRDSQSIGWSGIDIPDNAKPYVEAISRMRDELRGKARSTEGLTQKEVKTIVEAIPAVVGSDDPTTGSFQQVMRDFKEEAISIQDSPNLSKEILALTDRIRNVDLWKYDVYLEDRENEPTLIRPVTRELRAARQEREDLSRQKQLAKEERERQAAAKAEKGRLSHLDMFRTNEYSAWNDEGLPIKDAEGVNITKSRDKKLRKDQAAQKKLHEAWLAANVAKANSESANGS